MRRYLRKLLPWSQPALSDRLDKLVFEIAVRCRQHMELMLEPAPRHTNALQIASLVECVGLVAHLCRRAAHAKGRLAQIDSALGPALELVMIALASAYMKEANDEESRRFRSLFFARMTGCECLYTELELEARRNGRDPMTADVNELLKRVEQCYAFSPDDTMKGLASIAVTHALGEVSTV